MQYSMCLKYYAHVIAEQKGREESRVRYVVAEERDEAHDRRIKTCKQEKDRAYAQLKAWAQFIVRINHAQNQQNEREPIPKARRDSINNAGRKNVRKKKALGSNLTSRARH